MSDPEKPPRRSGIEAVQEAQRITLPKRFYQAVSVAARDGGFAVMLDGRPMRTPAKKLLVVPVETLAAALAEEWDAQKTTINPATMPLTRLVNSALDGVAGREAEVAAEIVKYAGGDLLLYRAAGPTALVARQARHWDPVLAWAEGWLGGRFILAEGIMPVSPAAIDARQACSQDRRYADAAARRAARDHDADRLGAAGTGARRAAHWCARRRGLRRTSTRIYQIELWGTDAEAETRRANRWREMQAASFLITASAGATLSGPDAAV